GFEAALQAFDTHEPDEDVISWEEAFKGIFIDQLTAWMGDQDFADDDNGADLGAALTDWLTSDTDSADNDHISVPGVLSGLYTLTIDNVSYSYNDEKHFSVEMDFNLEISH